jgi:RNA polymerase sigma factor (TIGR02999 family)
VISLRLGARPPRVILAAFFLPLPSESVTVTQMSEVTLLLAAAAAGDRKAAADLLPLVYDELRRLAAQKLAHEQPGHTLDGTALVHEAYLRLVASPLREQGEEPQFDNRGHFFAAAAEAMRRILIDRARSKQRVRHGGDRRRVPLDQVRTAAETPDDELLDLDDALTRLAELDPVRAELVKLRFFAGLTMAEAAALLDISVATAERYWAFARAWLHSELSKGED